jgi:AcrR family transcriptional regulator
VASLRTEQQAETRDRLLDAAAALFAETGFSGTSVAAIAKRAGVTTGAIYSNFAGKDDLFTAVVERHMKRQAEAYHALYSEGGTPAERMQRGADRWMALIAEDPDYFPLFVEVWRVGLAKPEIQRRLREAYADLVKELAALVREGAPTPLDEQGAEQFALLVCSLADGLAMHKILDPSHVPDDLFGAFLRFVIESGGTPPSQPRATAASSFR